MIVGVARDKAEVNRCRSQMIAAQLSHEIKKTAASNQANTVSAICSLASQPLLALGGAGLRD